MYAMIRGRHGGGAALIRWGPRPRRRVFWQATACNYRPTCISSLHRSPSATTTRATPFLGFLAPRSKILERKRISGRLHVVGRSYTPKQSGTPDFVMTLRPVEGTLPLT